MHVIPVSNYRLYACNNYESSIRIYDAASSFPSSAIRSFLQYQGQSGVVFFSQFLNTVALAPANSNHVIVADGSNLVMFDHTQTSGSAVSLLSIWVTPSPTLMLYSVFCDPASPSKCFAHNLRRDPTTLNVELYSFELGSPGMTGILTGVPADLGTLLPMVEIGCFGLISNTELKLFKLADGTSITSVSMVLSSVKIGAADTLCDGTKCEVLLFGDAGETKVFSLELSAANYASQLTTSFSYPTVPDTPSYARITQAASQGVLVSFACNSVPCNTAYLRKVDCHSNCLTCNGGLSNKCLSCASPKKLIGTECVICHSSCLPENCNGPAANQCTKCDNSAGMFLKPDSTCVPCATTVGFFISGISCLPCDSSCATCVDSDKNCKTCSSPSLFLRKDSSNNCLSDCPSGRYSFPDPTNSNQLTCNLCSSNCITCQETATKCLTCSPSLYLNPANNACQSTCDPVCLTCSVKTNNCASCKSGEKLQALPDGSSSCVIDVLDINLALATTEAANCIDNITIPKFCFEIGFNNKSLTSSEFEILANSMTLIPNLLSSDSSGTFVQVSAASPTNMTRLVQVGMLITNYSFASVAAGSPKLKFKLTSPTTATFLGRIGRFRYLLLPSEFVSKVWSPPPIDEQVTKAGQLGESTGGFVSGNPIPSKSAMYVLGAVAASDPTGIFSKFNQLLKIVNKLAFVETNYGPLLEKFFASIVATSGTLTADSSDAIYLATRDYRQKLLRYRVVVDFFTPALLWRALIYSVSFMLNLMPLLSETLLLRTPKCYLFLLAHWDRVHMVIFNFVFTDLLFYGANAMVRNRKDFAVSLGAFILTFAVTIDLVRFASLCFWDSPWNYHYQRQKKLKQALEKETSAKAAIKPEPEISNPKGGLETNQDKSAQNLLVTDNSVLPDHQKYLDYRSIYTVINYRIHIVDLFTETFRTERDVFESQTCRGAMLLHFIRVGAYQCLTISGQYSCKLVLAVLATAEGLRISITMRNHLKYKPYSNILFLVMELSQSVFLFLFEIVFIFATSSAKEDPALDIQKFGIWLIIISTGAEYFLILCFLILICYQAVQSCRKSKQATKSSKDPNSTWSHFMKYKTSNDDHPGFTDEQGNSDKTKSRVHSKLGRNLADSKGSYSQSDQIGIQRSNSKRSMDTSTEASSTSLQGRKLFSKKGGQALGNISVHPAGTFTVSTQPQKSKRDLLPIRYRLYESSSRFFDARQKRNNQSQPTVRPEYL